MRSICFALFLYLISGELAASLSQRIDEAAKSEMERQQIVGLAVGIIQGGRISYLKGYGWANRENRVPVSRKTMFRWASISKSLTALSAMQLWEKDQLKLDGDVRQYVPEFPDQGQRITPRQLLSHQSGIVHYSNGPVVVTLRQYDQPNPFENVLFALDTFKASPLVNVPGEKYAYTTHGFILLSAAVERAGEQKFAHQVRDRIARPLGMETLQPDYQWIDIPNRTLGYRKRQNKTVVSSNTDVSWKLGGGGYISNIDDLTKLGEGLLKGKLVKPETLKLMWTPRKTSTGKQTSYGLGFRQWNFVDGRLQGSSTNISESELKDKITMRLIGHSGSQEKTKTLLVLEPSRKFGMALMANSEHTKIYEAAEALLKAAIPQKP
jgi:CubicO group peptidase (beta-lactamase class C family)